MLLVLRERGFDIFGALPTPLLLDTQAGTCCYEYDCYEETVMTQCVDFGPYLNMKKMSIGLLGNSAR